VFAIWSVRGWTAGAGICSRTAGCSALRYLAAGLRGQAGAVFRDELLRHAQGAVWQESIFAGAGRRTRAELVVLAHNAQGTSHAELSVLAFMRGCALSSE
jgi:hypothetical protein